MGGSAAASGFVELHQSKRIWHGPQGHHLGQITPSYSSLSLGKNHKSNNFLCWGRCQRALGHCCPGKGFGCTLGTQLDPPSQDTAAGGVWQQGQGSRKGQQSRTAAPLCTRELWCPPALQTTSELARTRVPLWLQNRGSFLSRDFKTGSFCWKWVRESR